MPMSLLLLVGALGANQPLLPIYDARRPNEASPPTRAEATVLEKRVRPQAAAHWGETESCRDELRVVGLATGSFTRPRSPQRAVLYVFCVTGHGFANNGLAVFERGRLVLHLAYEGGWENAIGAVPDLDGNGLDELLIAAGGTNQGQTTSSVRLVELRPGGPRSLGIVQVYEDDCGALPGQPTATAYQLYARPGPTPAFYREQFRSGCDARRWTEVAGPEPVVLEPFEWTSERLK